MAQVNLNGKMISAETAHVPIVNRALSFGDGVFETIRVFSGKIPFLKYHYHRLIHGLKQLMFTVPDEWTLPFFHHELTKVIQGNGNFRIRMTVWRAGGGLYLPQSQVPRYLIEASEITGSHFTFNPDGITSDISQGVVLARNAWAHCKTINALPYVLAAIEKKKGNIEELFLKNDLEEIAEASAANVFILLDNQFYTPDLSSGCIAGVTRSIVKEIIREMGYTVSETPLLPDDLMGADAVFITNSISGIRWIRKFGDTNYSFQPLVEQIHQYLNARIDAYELSLDLDIK